MKKYLSRNVAALGTGLFVLLPFPGVIQAAPRLIGISGFSDGPGLYEINPTNAVTTLLFTPSPVSDTPTLGFSPTNGMLYFFGGVYAYRAADPVTGLNDPTKGGYQDTHYMAKIDLVTSNETGMKASMPFSRAVFIRFRSRKVPTPLRWKSSCTVMATSAALLAGLRK